MPWNVMQIFFYINLSYFNERQSFVIPFIADVMNRLDLLYLTFFYIARLRNVYLKKRTVINETFVVAFLGNRKGLISKTLM